MVHYDPFSAEVMEDPFPVYAKLRAEAPVYKLEKYDAWAISRFEDVWTLSSEPSLSVIEAMFRATLGCNVRVPTACCA